RRELLEALGHGLDRGERHGEDDTRASTSFLEHLDERRMVVLGARLVAPVGEDRWNASLDEARKDTGIGGGRDLRTVIPRILEPDALVQRRGRDDEDARVDR